MYMNGSDMTVPNRERIMNALAIAGFIALVGGGMWLAVYSTRFVPDTVNRLGSAAVYLGSIFTPAPEPTLSVIPTASTTISFGGDTAVVETPVTPMVTPTKSATPTAGQKTTNTIQIGGTSTTGTLSGLPDLITTINAVGYLTTTSPDSFVANSTVPSSGTAAVNFTIKNIGTNVTGSWCFTATIPTQSFYLYQSQAQQSLAPGDSIDYTLGFTQADRGADKMVSVSANSITPSCNYAITESKTDNNNASAKVTILY